MSVLTWGEIGSHTYETGVSKGVLYVTNDTGEYDAGVAWDGLINVTDKPEGAEAKKIYADNSVYATFRSAEEFKFSIEAYAYPTEFGVCDGTKSPVDGVYFGQQDRRSFGFCYRTEKGSDSAADDGYVLHLIYNATASPTEKSNDSINDSPDAKTFTWECDTTPVKVNQAGYKPTSEITFDSTVLGKEKMAKIEEKLYGSATDGTPTLPSPDERIALLKAA